MVKGEKKPRQSQYKHTKDTDFLTFEDKDETRIDWLYLEVDV